MTAQVVALNHMFTQLALHNSTMTIVDQIDRFTRLAPKAQGQCRATVVNSAVAESTAETPCRAQTVLTIRRLFGRLIEAWGFTPKSFRRRQGPRHRWLRTVCGNDAPGTPREDH